MHGTSPLAARAAALQQITRLVQRQGYMLAIQDAFWLILTILIASIMATCFIRMRRQTPTASQGTVQGSEGEVEMLEATVFE